MRRMRRLLLAAPGMLMLLHAWRAAACAACFGQSDAPMARGFNVGILALMGVVVFVLSGVAAFFIYLARRAARNNRIASLGAETPVGGYIPAMK